MIWLCTVLLLCVNGVIFSQAQDYDVQDEYIGEGDDAPQITAGLQPRPGRSRNDPSRYAYHNTRVGSAGYYGKNSKSAQQGPGYHYAQDPLSQYYEPGQHDPYDYLQNEGRGIRYDESFAIDAEQGLDDGEFRRKRRRSGGRRQIKKLPLHGHGY